MPTERKIDCERFCRGADELNRKRSVITRVITTLEPLLERTTALQNRQLRDKEVVLRLEIEGLCFVIVHCKKARSLSIRLLDSNGKDHLWRGSVNYADAIPAQFVLIVYNNLSRLVEEADRSFPEAKIYEYFAFFSRHAEA